MAVTFKKVKNKMFWKASTGADIQYSEMFKHYSVHKGSFFAHTATLEEAKKLVATDMRFN